MATTTQQMPFTSSVLTRAEKAYRLDGKVAVVTGGCGGIGSVVSQGLAELGAKIAISDWETAKATAFSDTLTAQGFESLAVTFDVLSVADTQRMFDDVASHYGQVDILVNCVGTQREEPAEAVTEEAFDRVYQVNLKGAMFQSQASRTSDDSARRRRQVGAHGFCPFGFGVAGPGLCGLLRYQGRIGNSLQAVGCRMGAAQDQCECGGADVRAHSSGGVDAVRSRVLQRTGVENSAGKVGLSDGRYECNRVSGIAGGRLHHRTNAVSRWRANRHPIA